MHYPWEESQGGYLPSYSMRLHASLVNGVRSAIWDTIKTTVGLDNTFQYLNIAHVEQDHKQVLQLLGEMRHATKVQ